MICDDCEKFLLIKLSGGERKICTEVSKITFGSVTWFGSDPIDCPIRVLKTSKNSSKEQMRLFRSNIDTVFSQRTVHALSRGGKIKKVCDIADMTEGDLLKIKDFGRKALNDVKCVLSACGKELKKPII